MFLSHQGDFSFLFSCCYNEWALLFSFVPWRLDERLQRKVEGVVLAGRFTNHNRLRCQILHVSSLVTWDGCSCGILESDPNLVIGCEDLQGLLPFINAAFFALDVMFIWGCSKYGARCHSKLGEDGFWQVAVWHNMPGGRWDFISVVIICVFRGFIYRKDLKRLHRTLSPFQLIGMQFPWEPVARSCCNRDLLDGIIFSSAYSLDACWDK